MQPDALLHEPLNTLCALNLAGDTHPVPCEPAGHKGQEAGLGEHLGCGGKEERPAELSLVQRTGDSWSL